MVPRWAPGLLAVLAGLALAWAASAGPWVSAELTRQTAPGVTSAIEGEIEISWGLSGLPEVTELTAPSEDNSDAVPLASVYLDAIAKHPAPELDPEAAFSLEMLLSGLGYGTAAIGVLGLFGLAGRVLWRGVAFAGAAGAVISVVLGDMSVSTLYLYLVHLPTGARPATTFHTETVCVLAIAAAVLLCLTGLWGVRNSARPFVPERQERLGAGQSFGA